MNSLSNTPPEDKKLAAGDGMHQPWLKRVAMVTGVLAGLGGFLTIRQAYLSDQAIYHSTEAVLKQAQASDAWALYQANSIKARLVETALDVGVADPNVKAKFEAKAKEYRDDQPKQELDAKDLQKQRDDAIASSTHQLKMRDMLNYSGAAGQLAIALVSVAALIKRKSLFLSGVVVGLIALAITAYGMLLSLHHV